MIRVAVIDDNCDAATSLALLLAANGYAIVGPICDATQALARIKAERPDVAILDIAMPGMDGYELAGRIRAEVDPPPKLVAVTGLGMACDKADAAQAGFDAHFTKPVAWAD